MLKVKPSCFYLICCLGVDDGYGNNKIIGQKCVLRWIYHNTKMNKKPDLFCSLFLLQSRDFHVGFQFLSFRP
jgi:hypothetical protein